MDSCKAPTKNFVLFDNVLLHVLILFVILSCMFVFIIEKKTSESINDEFLKIMNKSIDYNAIKQLSSNVNNKYFVRQILREYFHTTDPTQVELVENLADKLNSDVKRNAKETLNNLITDYNKNPDPLRNKTQSTVYQQIGMVIVFLVIVVCIINVLPRISGNNCGVLGSLFFQLLVVFACVGIIEYWFFTNVATKYIPTDTTDLINTFKTTALDLISFHSS
jgi:hypothetical protein